MPSPSRPQIPIQEAAAASAKPQVSPSSPPRSPPQQKQQRESSRTPPNNATPKPSSPKTTSPKPASPKNASPKPAAAEDPASYYGYLFDRKKKPTKVLDALLRAIGQHIIDEIGDKDVKYLTTNKLSSFYHAVNGDMDFLLKDQSPEDISALWAVYGCQHMLTQPVGDNKARPTIPTLTLQGFVEWQALQILLNPEEHSTWIRTAVKNFGLRHPDTREKFPVDLPKASLPSDCDPVIEAFHERCVEVLKEEEEQKSRSRSRTSSRRPSRSPPKQPRQPSPDLRRRYTTASPEARTHTRPGTTPYTRGPYAGAQRSRPSADPEAAYTTRSTYAHGPGGLRYSERRSPERMHDHERYDRLDARAIPRRYPHVRTVSPDADVRRHSFGDYPAPPKDTKEKDAKGAAYSMSDPKARPSPSVAAPLGATSRPPPAAAGSGPSVSTRPSLNRSHPQPAHFEIESESSETESDDSVANDNGEESPTGGGRAPRRRIHRPAPHPAPHPSPHTATMHAQPGSEPLVMPSLSRIYSERIPSGERITTSAVHPGITVHEPASPRIRSVPTQNHGNPSEPRRRSLVDSAIHKAQSAAQFLVGSGSGSHERRARSHGERNGRHGPGGPRWRYPSEDDPSDSNSEDDRRRRRGPPAPRHSMADREREIAEQDRRRLERDRQSREWEKEEDRRSRRYLSRPEPPIRRTSSHGDVDRRRDREYGHSGYDSRGRAPRRFAPEMRYES